MPEVFQIAEDILEYFWRHCVVEWRTCNREVAGLNLGWATSHQLSLPSLRGR